MYPTKNAPKRWVHDMLFQLYKNSNDYADLLDAAGNYERAEEVRENGRSIAREKILDSILHPETVIVQA